jgi:hypothetical protein
MRKKKPANRGNQYYLVKLTNQVIDSIKFNNLVIFEIFLFNYFF